MTAERQPTDDELVAAANRGQREALEQLYRRYRDWVLHVSMRYLRSEADALDVLQDAFVYVLGRFPGFELRASMKTFLYPVVRHLSLDRRQRRDLGPLPDGLAAAAGAAPADDALAAVLAALPEEQREVVWLRFADGLSLDEIAAAVEIPVGTVKSRLHHALRKLRADPATKKLLAD